MTQKNDFSQGNIPRLITRLALPMIGAELVNVLYNIVDRAFIARIPEVGTLALTGVGLAFPFALFASGFSALAGMGGSPLCSIARGEGDERKAERVMCNSFALLLFLGTLLMLASYLFKKPVLRLFGASDNTLPFADQYLSIYLIGTLPTMISLGMNPFINSQGFARTGMLTVVIGAALNCALDPLFILVLGLGIRGAALATVLSQLVSATWVLRFLTGHKSPMTGDVCILRLRPRDMRPDFSILRRVMGLGVSSFTMSMTESLVQITCNSTLAIYGGDTYVGVMVIISAIRQILMMPMTGFTAGLQPVMGFNYGAKRYDRVRQSFTFNTLVCLGYAAVMCLLIVLLPRPFIAVFSEDAALVEPAILPVRVYFCMFWALFMQMTGQRSFVALGKSRQAIFFSLLRKAFIVAPLAYLLPRLTGLGVMGVFIAEPVSDLVGSSACFITFMLTVWRSLKREEQKQRSAQALAADPAAGA